MSPPAACSARAVAGRVLLRVAEEGAWTSAALDAELAKARLDRRDAALATEIAYGALRVLPALDAAIDAKLARPGALDPLVRAALRVGAYELLHLARVPTHAAVAENVGWLAAARDRRLGGLVNAVLRKLAAERPLAPRPPERMRVAAWIEGVLEQAIGAERSAALLAVPEGGPPLCLRVREGGDPDELARRIRAEVEGAEVAHSSLAPRSLLVRRAGDVRSLRAWREGVVTVQEEGAQLVALALGARPGEQILDACAGHGGKTLLLSERVGPSGSVTAVDHDARKLAALEVERARLGLAEAAIVTRIADLALPWTEPAARFDRVLVDAPCTGLGTLVRRPEIALRLRPPDPERLAHLQLTIATHAAVLVRPGGTLAYAVCSLADAEGLAVAERVEAALPTLERLQPSEHGLPATDADGVLRIGPWLGTGTASAPDGYQVIRWRCRG